MVAIARTVLAIPGVDDDLRLGGANALSEFYLGHRLSADLDFFAMDPKNVNEVGRYLPSQLHASGLVAQVTTVRTGGGFRRFVVHPTDGGRGLQLDVGQWFPPQMEPPVTVDGIRVESFLELAVGKLLALIDRGEPKDAVDLWAICNIGSASLDQLLDAVFVKDPGLAEMPHSIAARLQEFGRELPAPMPTLVQPIDLEEVQHWFSAEAAALWQRLHKGSAGPA